MKGWFGRLLAQRWTEWRLTGRGASFRSTDADRVEDAYSAMSAGEFADVNGLQHWHNERVLPRLVGRCIGDEPVRGIDLGCGDGASTAILAGLVPEGSELIGYDLVEDFVARARRRPLPPGRTVRFACQSIAEMLRDVDGRPLGAGEVDLAVAVGVVGHHLSHDALERLAIELHRVVRPGGHAILDPGPRRGRRELRRLVRGAGFEVAHGRPWLGSRTPIAFVRTA